MDYRYPPEPTYENIVARLEREKRYLSSYGGKGCELPKTKRRMTMMTDQPMSTQRSPENQSMRQTARRAGANPNRGRYGGVVEPTPWSTFTIAGIDIARPFQP